ncbi:iron ABC transporter permease [Rhodobacteraceae bacterium]|nr:iron ABC transporter permease [Paracoccaceae bacterium]
MRGTAAILVVLLLLSGIDLCAGRIWLGPGELWDVLRQGPRAEMWVLVWDLRLPRILTALGTGAAFGLAGAICQSLFRNPLAAPELLGVTAGASLGAVALVLAGLQGLAISAGAAGGAVVVTGLLLAMAGFSGAITRLILTGVGLSLSTGALTGLLLARAGDRLAGDAMLWLTGSLNASGWLQAGLIWAALVPLSLGAGAGARALDRMELGHDLAQGLGIAVHLMRPALLALAAALVAAAVAVVGPVGFVGLMAGPIARAAARRTGPNLATAALAGALIMVVADLLVVLSAPLALMPVGIFTGLLGAPWLIWLIWRAPSERTA